MEILYNPFHLSVVGMYGHGTIVNDFNISYIGGIYAGVYAKMLIILEMYWFGLIQKWGNSER